MARELTPEERTDLIATHFAWQMGDGSVSRTFQFADFAAAMGFVTRVAIAAEKADHHPDIDIRWNKVTLKFSTHSIGSKLSDLDQGLVATIDAWEAQ